MQNWHILVVEDDRDGQELVSRMLKFHRIPHMVAETGEEAIQMLGQNTFTGCIIDLALPGIDGWGVLGKIRATPQLSALPCVAVTAFHSAEVAVKAIEAGFTAYFPKPLEPTSFVRELTQVMSS
jgi:two-component system CheB/CheR fusion protein